MIKKYILLLLFIPIVSLSQRINVSGSSYQVNVIELLPTFDGDFVSAKVQGRNTSIYVGVSQSVRLPIGIYTLSVGANYSTSIMNYNFDETNPLYVNYEKITDAIVPELEFQYNVLNTDFFSAYLSTGVQVYLSTLGYTYVDNVLEPYDYEYNYLWPYLSVGAVLYGNGWSVTPFIRYQIDPVYFEEFSDIDPDEVESSIEDAGIVTGIRFSVGF
jgi:hypothetical protein